MLPDRTRAAVALTAAAAAIATSAATAACPVIDFETLPVGTIVTDQIDGVLFDAVPDSCGGTTNLRVATLPGGTSSGIRCLLIDAGCPDFSPDYIRMWFDDLQSDVSFTVGATEGNVIVRAYRGDGTLVSSQTIQSTAACRTYVGVASAATDIRRIEIDSPVDDFEAIDDLRLTPDTTPPTARIDSPAFFTCVCDEITVTGVACDDGVYDRDRLEARLVTADPGEPWTLVREFVNSPVCTSGPLYIFDPVELELPPGDYYLRMTAIDACGNTSTDMTTVRYDTAPPNVNIDSPHPLDTVCGVVEFSGRVRDHCPVSWSLTAFGPGGVVVPIAAGDGEQCGVIAEWDTEGLEPGSWTVRLRGIDACGHVTDSSRGLTLDPACRADVDGDGDVDFQDLLDVLAAWTAVP